jgi:hypothetical protein
MGALVAGDNIQLHRIDSAIARIEERPPAEQRKIACLLAGLRSEKAEILRYSPRARQIGRADCRGSSSQPVSAGS